MRARRTVSWVVAVLVVVATGACGADPRDPGPMTGATASPAEETPTPAEDTSPPCLRADGNCLGVLAAGSYASSRFAAFGSACRSSWRTR